ncbi:hypothetical protein BJ508DRAFT_72694 [Ascobolus immersus RN42]|uniref:Uncharacterized protein n=1 Tax=Ascobolus immersus RN42 TaxID=1160509 RepID=A0A3N4HEB3_ASCIM|nr:hypothetical protein BJ508DRAFT_72694 [Ascobolus immersus RN42]
MPKKLSGMYELILKRLNAKDDSMSDQGQAWRKESRRRVLMWIAMAYIPITVQEMQFICLTKEQTLFEPEKIVRQTLKQEEQNLMQLCGSLVVLSPDVDPVLRFSHRTVKEFLLQQLVENSSDNNGTGDLKPQKQDFPVASQYMFTEQEAHTQMALISIKQLMSPSLLLSDSTKFFADSAEDRRNPFMYPVRYALAHATEVAQLGCADYEWESGSAVKLWEAMQEWLFDPNDAFFHFIDLLLCPLEHQDSGQIRPRTSEAVIMLSSSDAIKVRIEMEQLSPGSTDVPASGKVSLSTRGWLSGGSSYDKREWISTGDFWLSRGSLIYKPRKIFGKTLSRLLNPRYAKPGSGFKSFASDSTTGIYIKGLAENMIKTPTRWTRLYSNRWIPRDSKNELRVLFMILLDYLPLVRSNIEMFRPNQNNTPDALHLLGRINEASRLSAFLASGSYLPYALTLCSWDVALLFFKEKLAPAERVLHSFSFINEVAKLGPHGSRNAQKDKPAQLLFVKVYRYLQVVELLLSPEYAERDGAATFLLPESKELYEIQPPEDRDGAIPKTYARICNLIKEQLDEELYEKLVNPDPEGGYTLKGLEEATERLVKSSHEEAI